MATEQQQKGSRPRIVEAGWPVDADVRLQYVLRAWLRWRGDRAMPARSQLAPAEIREYLPWVYIYAYEPERDSYTCKLAGEEIHAAWRRTLMGADVADIFAPQHLPSLRQRYKDVLGIPVVSHGCHQGSDSYQVAERLLMPLSDDDGRPMFVFGMTLYEGTRLTDAGKGVPPPIMDIVYYRTTGLIAPD